MDVTGQSGSPGSMVLRAFAEPQPLVALARLRDSPLAMRLLRNLFLVALRRSFVGHDVREVTAYVHDLLIWLDLPTGGELAREAEALIRSALGEPALAEEIQAERRYAIMCAVVGDLARPPGPGEAVLAQLVKQAEQRTERFDYQDQRR